MAYESRKDIKVSESYIQKLRDAGSKKAALEKYGKSTDPKMREALRRFYGANAPTPIKDSSRTIARTLPRKSIPMGAKNISDAKPKENNNATKAAAAAGAAAAGVAAVKGLTNRSQKLTEMRSYQQAVAKNVKSRSAGMKGAETRAANSKAKMQEELKQQRAARAKKAATTRKANAKKAAATKSAAAKSAAAKQGVKNKLKTQGKVATQSGRGYSRTGKK
jgi:hypothetical protein